MRLSRVIAAALLGVAAIAASGFVGVTVAVWAHEEVPGVRSVIDSVSPPLPDGVTVQARISVADQLVVSNSTAVELLVLGEAGEPFLRIGPAGVLANLRSPTWYRSNDPTGTAVPPKDAVAGAEPLWALASKEPAWGWFDHRLHRTVLAGAPAVGPDPSKPVTLESWTVPMKYGDQAVEVKGHREYKVPAGAWGSTVKSTPTGLRVLALSGQVPALTAQRFSQDERVLVILGEGGEPMARLGPSGVEVNEASPTWVFSAEAKGGYVRTGAVGAEEPPRWVRQKSPSVTWLDRRGQIASTGAEGHPGERKEWRVPVLVGDQRAEIVAETAWEVSPAAAPNPILPGGGGSGGGRAGWRWWAGAGAGLVILGLLSRMWMTRSSTSRGEPER